MSQLPARQSTTSQRFVAFLASMLLVAAFLPASVPQVAAQPMPAAPSAAPAASGFLVYKFPVPQPACTGFGLNVSNAPYFTSDDCGFVVFTISGATPTSDVTVDMVAPDGSTITTVSASWDTIDLEWQFNIVPSTSWAPGLITARVMVDGEDAGSMTFGHRLLGASMELDLSGAPYVPGDDFDITGNIAELDSATDLGPVLRTGVPATFSLAVRTPAGEPRTVPGGPISAAATGDFSATIPGALTADLAAVGNETELTIAVMAIDASYTDPGTGVWAAAQAGSLAVTLLDAPDTLSLEASFVSSVGWVKPGETYPFRIFVTNATLDDATDVTVTLNSPPSATFIDATPLNGAGSAATTAASITWNVGTVPAATAAGPNVRTLVVSARAASLSLDPEVVWKDLSTTASMTYAGYTGSAIESATHGPKVIPPAAEFDTARYGDKPFPMVPVEYVDLDRQSNATWDNDSDKLDTIVNDPDFEGSTWNLYREMSFGQLFPHGTVPSAGIASATFSDYQPGFDFTTTDHTNPLYAGCRGTTAAEAPGVVGSPAFDTRVDDGWYQLPGTTEYYGGDFPVFTSTTVAIDQACGPIGKAVYDAAQIADPEIDYNEYDSDKDGVVDFFMMVFVGCGGNGASQVAVLCEYFGNQAPFYDNIWPHSASLEGMYQDPATGLRGYISDDQLKSLHEVPQCWTSTARTQYDDCAADGGSGVDALPVFVRVGPYNVNPETVFQSASVISHEYGHHLGLPDFYNSGAEVYGDLNLMAADYSQNMTIFSKQELGWVVPEYLEPNETRNVNGWKEIKEDTGQIKWLRPDGTMYTLSAANGDQNIHNGQAYALKLGGRQLIDPASIPSGSHAWWSGRGNDFGCSPSGAHNLDIALPELAAFPAGTPVKVEFKSSWDIEWDYDYGFVLTTTDGLSYTSHASQNGYTTTSDFNPNQSSCLSELNNGLTGTSGAWEQGPAAVTAARAPLLNDYSHGAPFLADAYDISELAGEAGATLRLSYSTDPGFDRPGWFIDDIVVTAGTQVVYSSDFEDAGDLYRMGPDGWSRINASDDNPADHAYYLELRDQSGFDYDGHNQSDRGDTSWQPGVFIEYTDEAHGYGNNGTPDPPAQHYLDSQPIPGSDCVDEQGGNCADVSFTAAAGDSHFSDAVTAAQPGGFVNSFSDPNSAYGDDFWHFDYGCLTLDVTAMAGEGVGPEAPAHGDLTASAVISAGEGCASFGYGVEDNLAPVAVAQARPTETTVDSPVTFDGSGSSDDRQAPSELDYHWEFGDGAEADGQTVHHAYDALGEYTATLTVTDADGLAGTDTVAVTVAEGQSSGANLVVSDITTVENTGNQGEGKQPKQGDKVVIRATITNSGTAEAAASTTAVSLDGEPLPGSPVETPAIPAGGSVQVDIAWDTRTVKDDHVIEVVADAGNAVAESDETDNAATLQVTVRGNKVTNGDFETANPAGDGPDAWEPSDGAGSTGYSESAGSDGSAAVTITGDGRSVALAGMPTWSSAPIEVSPGSPLELQVSVLADGLSSAPGVGLAYLGPAGQLLSTVRLLEVPLSTDGFATLSSTVDLPAGVAQVRVLLLGFSPTDLHTAGTVVFDEVGLFE